MLGPKGILIGSKDILNLASYKNIYRAERCNMGTTVSKEEKLENLKNYLKELGSVAIAFSSGVDSTFLMKVAHDVLGEKAVAVTAVSCSFPVRELNEAKAFCERENIRQFICESEELDIDGFSKNPKNRCYLCKKELFSKILDIIHKNGIEYVAEGSNIDDNGDYRPGLQAVAELGIKSPLRHVGLYKSEIRELSKNMGLSTWSKSSFACLSSRFVYGETINREKLKMVELAEEYLMQFNLSQVRVRIHGEKESGIIARIELSPDEIEKMMKNEVRNKIYDKFKEIGFDYVSMDMFGYRMGSMNETL